MQVLDYAQLKELFHEFGQEGRDPQLYATMDGQWIFAVTGMSGGISAHAFCFLISHGKGERAPAYNGSFPVEHHGTVDLGDGWIVLALRVPFGMKASELRQVLVDGEAALAALRRPVS